MAKRAFRKGALAIRARDEPGSWLGDAAFAAAYGVRGPPGISPAQLAMVSVLTPARYGLRSRGQVASAPTPVMAWQETLRG